MRVRSHIIVAAALFVVAAAAPAAAAGAGRGHWGEEQALRFHVGQFEPRGESSYWDEKGLDFFGGPEEFDDVDLGAAYVRFLGPRLGLAIGSDYYASDRVAQSYRDFVDERGGEIVHETQLEVMRLTLGLLLNLTRRDAAVQPYVGAGAGFYFWSLTEVGDFIDFDRDREIFFADFTDDGVDFGYYLKAGLEVPLATNWAVFAEARRDRAEASLGGDFRGLGDLDLSGVAYSLGASFSF